MTGRYSERMLGDVVHKLWDLKQTGLAAETIGLRIGRSKAAVLAHVCGHGGVRPRWGRELQGRSLSMDERETILQLKSQYGVREITRRLGRSPSTVSRELSIPVDGLAGAEAALWAQRVSGHSRSRAGIQAGQTAQGS